MTKFLLSVHVLAAIIAIGPVTVAASMFPAAARRALASPGDIQATAAVHTLFRICRVYSAVGLAVPAFGLATGAGMHILGSGWLVAAIILTAVAAAVLVLAVLPGQQTIIVALGSPDTPLAAAGDTGPAPAPVIERAQHTARRLAMFTGAFNLLWATVTVLMVVRPGSTTGA